MQFQQVQGARQFKGKKTRRLTRKSGRWAWPSGLWQGVSLLCCASGPVFAQVYTPTEIGTLGGDSSFAHGINEAGAVAGYARNAAGENRAFIFTSGSPMDLGTLGGSASQAFAINNNNDVVGFSRTSGGLEHAFRYSGGIMTDLGTLGGNSSYAFAINDGSEIAGGSTTSLDLQYRAFRLSGMTMTDLGTLGGFFGSSEALGIDADGTVVGWSSMLDFTQKAFIYRNNMMTSLGTLGGTYSYAQAIRSGVVVGGAFEEGNTIFRAFRWENGTTSNLGALPGITHSFALALNGTGQIVGKADDGSDESARAFLHLGGTMIDLNDLIAPNSGWILQQARGINNAGQIAGFGTFNGQSRGFVLNLTGKIWFNPAGGQFATAGNWFSAGAPSASQSAVFPLDSTYTVNITSAAASKSLGVTRGNVTFDVAGATAYTVAEGITVAANATMNVQGTGSLSAASISSGGVVQILGGEVKLRADGGTSDAADLRFGGTIDALSGRLDITNNALVIDYTGESPIAIVRGQIRSGRGSGAWDGAGLASSSADASARGLGYAEAAALFTQFPAMFAGREVDATSVLIQLTRYGDANLDGIVNLSDFNALAANFGQSDRFWNTGDFNYDGIVNLSDFNLLAANFGLSASPDGPGPDDWAALGAAVPEPAVGGVVLASALVLRRRSRHLSVP